MTHSLCVVPILTQQCSPSGLKCVVPRSRKRPPLTALVISSSPTGTPTLATTAVPLGSCHSTLVVFWVKQYQGNGSLVPVPISENEMISPVWSMGRGSLPAARWAVHVIQHITPDVYSYIDSYIYDIVYYCSTENHPPCM